MVNWSSSDRSTEVEALGDPHSADALPLWEILEERYTYSLQRRIMGERVIQYEGHFRIVRIKKCNEWSKQLKHLTISEDD